MRETREEVIRKLRMTRLISSRGAGSLIDTINFLIEMEKAKWGKKI